MKFTIAILALLIVTQSFAHDHREDRGRAERAEQNRRRNEDNRRREEERRRRQESEINIFDISNTLILSSWTSEDSKTEATQVINDSQEFMQSGVISVFLNQKINEIQNLDQDLSLEDAIDLIVDSAKAKLE